MRGVHALELLNLLIQAPQLYCLLVLLLALYPPCFKSGAQPEPVARIPLLLPELGRLR